MKISIVGSGKVGAALAYAAVMKGLARQIVLVDAHVDRAQGEAIDILQCQAFTYQTKICHGSLKDTAGSDIVVITAGIPRQPGETRVMLISKNARLIADLVEQVAGYSPQCILFMVTNPLDVMTQLAYQTSGFPVSRVIGMGTVLDTARYRAHIAEAFGVDARDVDAYVIGEHGDTMTPVLSNIRVKGVPLEEMADFSGKRLEKIAEEVICAGKQIISLKGATVFAPATSACRVLEAIVHDSQAVLPVCTFNERYNLCVSMPTIVDRKGAGKVFGLRLTPAEEEQFNKSLESIRASVQQLNEIVK